MEKLEILLDTVLKPFKLEYEQKCTNESVIGGFDKFVRDHLDRIMLRATYKTDIRNRIKIIQDKIDKYPGSLPFQRKRILKEVYEDIKSLSVGNSPESFEKNQEKNETPWFRDKLARKINTKDYRSALNKLQESVSNLTGIGPRTAQILHNLNIFIIEDLLFHLPREYQDRREILGVNQVEADKFQVVKGRLGKFFTRKVRRGLTMIKTSLMDENGGITLVWFNQPYVRNLYTPGKEYVASGKVEYKYGQLQMSSPGLEELDEVPDDGVIEPLYPLTQGVSQNFMRKMVKSGLRKYSQYYLEVFTEDFLYKLGLMEAREAIHRVHFPGSQEEKEKALLRLRFEEAFFLQLIIARYRRSFKERIKPWKYDFTLLEFEKFQSRLPFQLTGAQKKVIQEIREDLESGYPMNRLLQGDVGSGKTIICVFFAVMNALSGQQTAIMAPTEVLAEQHYYNFRELLSQYGLEVELLIGSTPLKEKEGIKSRLAEGRLQIVIGTHALIQENVEFKNLSFMVIDEQHKFGVMQRTTLKEKGEGIDCLFMTATPIPRSLCLTLYGDMDISVLDEMPPGRQEICTRMSDHRNMEEVYSFLEKEMERGGQVYLVCPLIEESEKIDARALENEFEVVEKRFPNFRVGLLHGRMKGPEKEKVMREFSAGEIQILVCTTVIEVGVDVAAATVMVILDANRFGLGQLHQLRGRVGRGKNKSYCILVSKKPGELAMARLKTLIRYISGFDIAEADLKIRGPGDFIGVRQSGLPELRFLNIVRDFKIVSRARQEAFKLLKEDPDLSKKEHRKIKEKLNRKYKKIWDIIH
ncbi:MAG: ATP-dependent DNA helicase RecG [Vulcanimicrobiota bacterium]